ncbi:response regulator [Singulisphaera rosea]
MDILGGRSPQAAARPNAPTRIVGRLLIVEDNSMSRRVLETLFSMRGWEVSSASTLVEAFERLSPPPDCIILDLMLPDGDGEEILRHVREQNLPSRVIVTTGCHDPIRLAAVSQLVPAALLYKPLDFFHIAFACRAPEPRTIDTPVALAEASGVER